MYVDGKGNVHLQGVDPEWIPSVDKTRIDDRTDSKWTHPEVTESFKNTQFLAHEVSGHMYEPCAATVDRQAARDGFVKLSEEMNPPTSLPVEKSRYTIKGMLEGDPDIDVVIWKPRDTRKKRLDVLFAVGQGAMCQNSEIVYESVFAPFCVDLDVAIVFPVARSGIDVPYPKPLDEYQAAYSWVTENAKDLGLNGKNIVLYGDSGGGYVALCFAFRCKNVGFHPKGVMLIEPVMGDNFNYPSSRIICGSWDAVLMQRAYKNCILRPGDGNNPFASPEIAPDKATVDDCRGLCPVYIHTMELEPCRDPIADFAYKCLQARVFTQLHIWGGMAHASLSAGGESRIHKIYNDLLRAELADMFEFDLRRLWLNEEVPSSSDQ